MTQARRITKKRMDEASRLADERNQRVRLNADGSIEFEPRANTAEHDEALDAEARMNAAMGAPAR